VYEIGRRYIENPPISSSPFYPYRQRELMFCQKVTDLLVWLFTIGISDIHRRTFGYRRERSENSERSWAVCGYNDEASLLKRKPALKEKRISSFGKAFLFKKMFLVRICAILWL